MAALKKEWLTEDLLDFEYKKYMILAYIQDIKKHYERSELYPSLSEVLEHYKNLKQIKDQATFIKKKMNKDVSGINWQKLELIRKEESSTEGLTNELELVIDFTIPLFLEQIQTGTAIFHTVEQNLTLSTIGISPLRRDEGYLILNTIQEKEAHVFQYGFSQFQKLGENMKQLFTEYICTYSYGISVSFEKIKHDLITQRKALPNPAVYLIRSKTQSPFTETLLPVAKRFFAAKFYQQQI